MRGEREERGNKETNGGDKMTTEIESQRSFPPCFSPFDFLTLDGSLSSRHYGSVLFPSLSFILPCFATFPSLFLVLVIYLHVAKKFSIIQVYKSLSNYFINYFIFYKWKQKMDNLCIPILLQCVYGNLHRNVLKTFNICPENVIWASLAMFPSILTQILT